MAIKADNSPARPFRAAVIRLVELLLRKRSQEQPQPVELLRIQDAVEQLEEIIDRDQLSLRHVAQIGSCGQVNRRRELGYQVVRQIKVEVETSEITPFLLLDLVD